MGEISNCANYSKGYILLRNRTSPGKSDFGCGMRRAVQYKSDRPVAAASYFFAAAFFCDRPLGGRDLGFL